MTENYPPSSVPLPGDDVSPREEEVLPGADVLPPGGEVLPPGADVLPPGGEVLPPGGEVLPPGADVLPPGGEVLPPGGEVLPPPPAQGQGTAAVVQDQAADLGHSGVEAGKHAAGVAREQASDVVAEARRQGSDLMRQAQDQLTGQAAQGQRQLSAQLVSLGDELKTMADGSDQQGMAADLARQAASRARHVGQWLGEREPAQVLDEVQAFARRRPAVFLAVAVAVGVAAGRLTRGMQAASNGAQPAGGDSLASANDRAPRAGQSADGWNLT
jgi:hypothetical protein